MKKLISSILFVSLLLGCGSASAAIDQSVSNNQKEEQSTEVVVEETKQEELSEVDGHEGEALETETLVPEETDSIDSAENTDSDDEEVIQSNESEEALVEEIPEIDEKEEPLAEEAKEEAADTVLEEPTISTETTETIDAVEEPEEEIPERVIIPEPEPEPEPDPIVYNMVFKDKQTVYDCKPNTSLNALDMIYVTDGIANWNEKDWIDKDFTVKASQAVLDLGRSGTQTVNYTLTYTDETGKSVKKTLTRVFTKKDSKAPTIMCRAAVVYLYVGDNFDRSTANLLYVRDDIDGEIPYSSSTNNSSSAAWYTATSNVNTSVAGTYKVDLKAQDRAGNVSTETYSVVVSNKPVQQPQTTYTAQTTTSSSQTYSSAQNYIANKNTKKFHYPWCGSVSRMKESNKWYYYGSRDDLINAGYSPCGNCHP